MEEGITSLWRGAWITAVVTLLFTAFATTIMCFISLAVPVGPWIDPTLALMSLGILALCAYTPWYERARSLFFTATIAGSIGGIVASAIAWSIPTIYFFDAALFAELIRRPVYFGGVIAFLVIAAGGVGLFVARVCLAGVIQDASFPFPIARLVTHIFAAQDQIRYTYQLFAGMMTAGMFHLAQMVSRVIPATICVLREHQVWLWQIPKLMCTVSTIPLFWAVGYIVGNMIIVPFVVGFILKIAIVEPCYRVWFAHCLHPHTFLIAFTSGLVLYGVLHAFAQAALRWYALWYVRTVGFEVAGARLRFLVEGPYRNLRYLGFVAGFIALCFLMGYALLSLVSAWYVLLATAMCAYQLILMMGRIGLAPLGRFATFVMVPGLVLFGHTPVQAILIAAFVEVAGGVAASAASGFRAAALLEAPKMRDLYWYQWLAVVVAGCVVGVVLYLLVTYMGLGSSTLVAQRAYSRALLIKVHEMHWGGIGIGMLIGMLLQKLRINGTLVLGGLLMSADMLAILILGGLSSKLVRKPEEYTAFWSGVFTISSLWLILSAVFGGSTASASTWPPITISSHEVALKKVKNELESTLKAAKDELLFVRCGTRGGENVRRLILEFLGPQLPVHSIMTRKFFMRQGCVSCLNWGEVPTVRINRRGRARFTNHFQYGGRGEDPSAKEKEWLGVLVRTCGKADALLKNKSLRSNEDMCKEGYHLQGHFVSCVVDNCGTCMHDISQLFCSADERLVLKTYSVFPGPNKSSNVSASNQVRTLIVPVHFEIMQVNNRLIGLKGEVYFRDMQKNGMWVLERWAPRPVPLEGCGKANPIYDVYSNYWGTWMIFRAANPTDDRLLAGCWGNFEQVEIGHQLLLATVSTKSGSINEMMWWTAILAQWMPVAQKDFVYGGEPITMEPRWVLRLQRFKQWLGEYNSEAADMVPVIPTMWGKQYIPPQVQEVQQVLRKQPTREVRKKRKRKARSPAQAQYDPANRYR